MKTCLRYFISLAVSLIMGVAIWGSSVSEAQNVGESDNSAVVGSIVQPKVFFITPKDGATVKSEFKVQFGIKGMKIAKSGPLVPGAGHHHIVVDGAPYPKGQVVPADEKNIHFGKGETETTLKLSPGVHTLTLQFADGEHKSYGETLSQTIKVTVQ